MLDRVDSALLARSARRVARQKATRKEARVIDPITKHKAQEALQAKLQRAKLSSQMRLTMKKQADLRFGVK